MLRVPRYEHVYLIEREVEGPYKSTSKQNDNDMYLEFFRTARDHHARFFPGRSQR